MAQAQPVMIDVPDKLLTRWNAAMATLHGGLAIVTLTVGNPNLRTPIYGMSVGAQGAGGGNFTEGWELVPEVSERAGYFYFTVAVAAFFLICAFFHLGNALLWRDLYLRLLAQCYCPSRWIEYSFSASVMVLLIGYTTGSIMLNVLVLLFALTLVTMFFGHLHEVICRPASPEQWAEPSVLWRLQAHVLGYVPQVAAWGVMVAQFAQASGSSSTDEDGNERRMPGFVYAIVSLELVLFWSFGLVQLVVSLRAPKDYIKGELAYQVLSLVAKGLLGLLFLSNVLVLDRYTDAL
jgi:hypothetical protein